ncbi:Retrovirus-related Pol polyprotein from transposon TNT 1-94 [Dendrobium catenatum]|uniref:Retrovirus-related Pol polyprotein from transposon TNT 1-94 n=1 Tax=Dendrobium catenatum TaxID=906689 RepID=A0A2I0VAG9_9ASPA|nr:Retrovirus-related Pol polyprotein from transposon TNT 1-94 [Dendrobium catenatum]
MTMTQYLAEIKNLVDQIVASGSTVDNEDIILYILNGLPSSYQAFKTSIRIMLNPISLENLYPLLLSEEINIACDAARNLQPADPHLAMYAYRGKARRTKQKHRLNTNYVPTAPSTTNRALVAATENSPNTWFLDSGATSHLTHSMDNLSVSTPYQGSDGIMVGDGRSVSIANSGVGLLPTPLRKLTMSQILHTPELYYNLISISKLIQDNDISITFDSQGFMMKDLKTQQVLLRGPCTDGLYPIITTQSASLSTALSATTNSANCWHHRLGHPNQRVTHLISNCNPHLKIKDCISCSSCSKAKSHKLVFELSNNRRNDILELIHSDIWGPHPLLLIKVFVTMLYLLTITLGFHGYFQ